MVAPQLQRPIKGSDLPSEAICMTSVPNDFPEPEMRWKNSAPEAIYPYYNADGTLAHMIARFQTENGKTFLPYTLWLMPDRTLQWVIKGPGDNIPLFELPEALKNPHKKVVITEGEKCAVIMAECFPEYVTVTWCGGSNAIAKTDFTSLAGREVIIFPDDDEAGRKAAQQLSKRLTMIGAESVRIIDTGELAKQLGAPQNTGFDAADCLVHDYQKVMVKALLEDKEMSGSTSTEANDPKEELVREVLKEFEIRPEYHEDFDLSLNGLLKEGVDKNGRPTTIFVASPILVLGRTRLSGKKVGWGFWVAVRNCLGEWTEVFVPAKLLADDGKELRALLADAGATVPTDRQGRLALMEYIGYAQNGPVIKMTNSPGWVGKAFVLPDEVISEPGKPANVRLDLGTRSHLLTQSGTFEDWRDLTMLAAPNSRAIFALSAALAAPLLQPLGMSGGGFNLFGNSSRGKTTMAILAGSVWGGGGKDGFVQNWNSTKNGAEALISDHNDLLLPLDELTAVSPELAPELYYMLTNGQGKNRAHVDGTSAPRQSWKALVLSTGERTAAQQVTQGRGKAQMTGGLAVRMVDTPMEYTPGQALEDYKPFSSSREWVNHVKTHAQQHYGHAGRVFLRQLVKKRDENLARVRRYMNEILGTLIEEEDDPQVQRVAEQFALVGAAGHLASDFGVLTASPDQILAGVTSCYQGWRNQRGGGVSEERRLALRHLKRFFEAHGPTKFERLQRTNETEKERTDDFDIRDRCGYRELDKDDAWIYYVLPGAWDQEVCGVHLPELMADIARDAGALILGENGRAKKKVRLPDYPNGTRVYAIRPDLL